MQLSNTLILRQALIAIAIVLALAVLANFYRDTQLSHAANGWFVVETRLGGTPFPRMHVRVRARTIAGPFETQGQCDAMRSKMARVPDAATTCRRMLMSEAAGSRGFAQ